ncbi:MULTISPECIES: YppG family protein [Heyndrickxia]|jgi:hypothetical protein|uniref:YppG family protein n=1 Tax=Heyndrickxia TaxID=2837504 RepID=UPI0007171ACC|nr:YppG family protein [Heyndrickxia oleronia]MCI1593559.1 YppG family protein [Heyndrickxia oleronia]MCI1612324.1 YppG family protein [Heyndrickxia oleronia]MCI1746537.1 YppG family protein [Heyndrickxia oleronia]MCI1761935.1 YppG family protein [Heyndrickxia oleronia]
MKGYNPYMNYLPLRNYQPQNHSYHAQGIPHMQAYNQPNIPYQHPYGPYHYNGIPPFMQNENSPYYQQPGYEQNHSPQPNIFDNPLQTKATYQSNKQNQMLNQYVHPYPQGNHFKQPQTGGINSLMNSFKSQDGSIDFNKMVNTAGQMMNAVNQVSTMVKGLGGLFKP